MASAYNASVGTLRSLSWPNSPPSSLTFIAFVSVDYLKLFHLQLANKAPYEDIERGTVGCSCAPIQSPFHTSLPLQNVLFRGKRFWLDGRKQITGVVSLVMG